MLRACQAKLGVAAPLTSFRGHILTNKPLGMGGGGGWMSRNADGRLLTQNDEIFLRPFLLVWHVFCGRHKSFALQFAPRPLKHHPIVPRFAQHHHNHKRPHPQRSGHKSRGLRSMRLPSAQREDKIKSGCLTPAVAALVASVVLGPVL